MGNPEQVDSGSAANDEIKNRLIDDLYISKSSLVCGEGLAKGASGHLKQIRSILEECPELSMYLLRWKFLENEALYCLRSQMFNISLEIITMVVSHCKLAPELYFSKKFLFFITERLYFSLSGMEKYREGGAFRGVRGKSSCAETDKFCDLFDNDCTPNQPDAAVISTSEAFSFDRTDDAMNPSVADAHPNYSGAFGCREIVVFIKILIEARRQVVSILFDIGFFDLSNVVIAAETAQMFNAVFEGVTYTNKSCGEVRKKPWEQDGLYEIRRTLFEPEVVFRSRDILVPKRLVQRFKAGVFHEIYKQCTSIRDFADLGVRDFMDALLYKRIVYMSDDLDVLLLEGKNPKILRFYRRSLEEGSVPSRGYLSSLIKALDDRKLSREACIALYYFIDLITDFRLFTEDRVRRIFENLEYVCEHECTLDGDDAEKSLQTKKRGKDVSVTNQDLVSASFNSDLHSDDIFGDGASSLLFEAPRDISYTGKWPKNASNIYSEPLDTSQSSCHPRINENHNRCERLRIIKLLKFLYSYTEKRIFYKPTYMILLRSVYAHCSDERSFMDAYLTDFVNYLNSGPTKIAECLMPIKKLSKPPKMINLELPDDLDVCLSDKACVNAETSIPLSAEDGLEDNYGSEINRESGSYGNSVSKVIQGEDTVQVVRGRVESDEGDF